MDESILFFLKTGGFGFVTGFVIGYAFKNISKFLVILVGVFLIFTQLMIYNGIIDINWIIIETAT